MEGDTTIFYINKQLKAFEVLISTIARGIPVGDELEYADEVTSRPKYPKTNTIRGFTSRLVTCIYF